MKKKILGDFHGTKEKMERDCGNKMQTLQKLFQLWSAKSHRG